MGNNFHVEKIIGNLLRIAFALVLHCQLRRLKDRALKLKKAFCN